MYRWQKGDLKLVLQIWQVIINSTDRTYRSPTLVELTRRSSSPGRSCLPLLVTDLYFCVKMDIICVVCGGWGIGVNSRVNVVTERNREGETMRAALATNNSEELCAIQGACRKVMMMLRRGDSISQYAPTQQAATSDYPVITPSNYHPPLFYYRVINS